MATTSDELLTTREVAEYLGVSMSWVLKHWERGELPGFKLGRSTTSPLRFRRSEIEAWLEQHRQGPRLAKGEPALRAI